jgi:hypothetical protein
MNKFSKLSDGDGTIFLLRWRGRQEGPYTGPVIEAKLAANEIGLLHEIYYEGRWITLRDYIGVRANILRAESQAREEQEQKLKQEAERKAAAREAMLRAEPPAGETPKIIPAKAPPAEPVRRRENPEPEPEPPPRTPVYGGLRGMKLLGALLLLVGLALAVYFFFVFDPSVAGGAGRVADPGRVAGRHDAVILGLGLGVAGAVLLALGFRGKTE